MIATILGGIFKYMDTLPPLVLILIAAGKKELRSSLIFYFLVLQCVLNMYANLLTIPNTNNLYIYHYNCLFSFFILSLFYIRLFNTPNTKRIIFGAALLFTLLFLIDTIYLEPMDQFNSNSFCLAAFILCGYSLYYFMRIFKNPTGTHISMSRDFWFNTGIFSYYTINFFIFITYNKLTIEKSPLLIYIWQLHNTIFLIMCIYFYVGIQCKTND